MSINKLKDYETIKQRYEMLLHTVQDGVLILNRAELITLMNPAASLQLGYTPSELIGKPISTVAPGLEMDGDPSANQREGKWLRKDGTVIEVQYITAPLLEGNASVGILTVFRDVSEQKRLRRTLKHAMRIGQMGCYEWDVQKNRAAWSVETKRIFGVSAHVEPSTLQDFLGYLHPEDKEEVLKKIEGVMKRRRPPEIQFRIIRPDKQIRYIRQSGDIITDARGQAVRWTGIVQDITEQQRTKQMLIEKDKQFHMVIQSARDAIILINHQGWIRSWNKGAEQIFGYRETEAVGNRILLILPKRYVYLHRVGVERCLAKARNLKKAVQFHGLTKSGEEIPVEMTLTPWKSENETLYLGIIRDIRERKRTEELLLKSEKLSTIGQLAASIAHEIRNPLTAIRGFLDLIADQSNKNEYYTIIRSELERIESIVSEFLQLAKPRNIVFRPENPAKLVHDVVTLIQPQAILNNVRIEMKTETNLPRLVCDANRLKQAFLNILKNAIEAMPSGGRIHVSIHRDGDGGITIRFADEGEGIPQHRLKKVMDSFYTTKKEGTGLGLLVTHQIVKEHKGSFHLESTYGKGTTVTLHFPADRSPPDPK